MDNTQQDPQGSAWPGAAAPAGRAGTDGSDAVISGIVRTGPWARFMAVLGFVGVGFMCLAGLLIMLAGTTASGLGAGMGAAMGLFYILMAAVYLIPLVPLSRFASEAARLKASPSLAVAASAIEHGRSFWVRAGVLAIIALAIGAIVLAFGFVMAIANL